VGFWEAVSPVEKTRTALKFRDGVSVQPGSAQLRGMEDEARLDLECPGLGVVVPGVCQVLMVSKLAANEAFRRALFYVQQLCVILEHDEPEGVKRHTEDNEVDGCLEDV
jgi:hypothetical protein